LSSRSADDHVGIKATGVPSYLFEVALLLVGGRGNLNHEFTLLARADEVIE
jgi:hypothetical protein